MSIQILTYKDYQKLFACCAKTAQKRLSADRKDLGKKITNYNLFALYGITVNDVDAILNPPKSPKNR